MEETMTKLDQAHKDGVVLGLRDVGVGERLDIDVMLMTQPDTFNLFLIALMEVQGKKVDWEIDPGYSFTSDNIMSWFQIAGIHGLPGEAWDGEDDRGKKPDPEGRPRGYCAHSTPTFSPWHRPYLSMLEQTLFRQVANVAQRFSRSSEVAEEDKKKYIAAAKQFRLPYWDYYRPRGYEVTFPGVVDGNTTTSPYDYHAPKIFTRKEVMIKVLPDNKLKAMPNPFFDYAFEVGDSKKIPWEFSNLDTTLGHSMEKTIRHGGSEPANVESMNTVLNKIREDEMRSSLAMIELGAYSNFQAFSTDGVNVKQKFKYLDPGEALRTNTGSIEDLHGDYHVYIGGFQGTMSKMTSRSGHMSCVPVAAFDPIFWIHHCQIDRILAIWQAANGREHWFNELTDEDEKVLGSGSLHPFRKWPLTEDKAERYWTPDRAWDTADFGYVYPETAGGKTGEQVRDEFARRYGWSRRLDVNQEFGAPPEDMQPLDVSKAQVFNYKAGVSPGDILKPLIPPQSKKRSEQEVLSAAAPSSKFSQEWYIDVVVERMALNGSYTIFYVIGDVDGESGQEWSTLPGFVGVSHIFTAPTEACENCARQQEQTHLVTSTTPITSLLLDYANAGKLGSMSPEDVEPFLVKNLKWRVQTIDGKVIDPRDLDKDHTMKLGISRKTAPMPGQTGDVDYSFHPKIIKDIIDNASPKMTPLSVH
ncbi:tyrosinase precursor (monophenol monooxygenase) [Fusarium beomiforme]|uniref:tyrosinase n=1 Tax=Fusarium beomiforme TaxID=44412 RepID=A0A9P5AA35_9HYPO|nr:tyrosinase precursor (monophenol monooxygenase) [Fusarium beomiforme]